jgi:hypothetical protein
VVRAAQFRLAGTDERHEQDQGDEPATEGTVAVAAVV